ncbi:zinc-ribbon domain-containing protein [Rhodococcus sp. NPDC059968]|uniref:zinc-ribbon domain-containing protein n=1 Tax=Rhodococcus sp. NPDC059968 TaxID=3347017 RepID=UPI00366B9F3A
MHLALLLRSRVPGITRRSHPRARLRTLQPGNRGRRSQPRPPRGQPRRAPAVTCIGTDRTRRPPNRTAEDIAPGSNFRAKWRCTTCSHMWSATVSSRALGGAGCPACGRLKTAAARSTPKPGASVAELHPAIAAELVENLTRPGRGPEQLRTGSHDRCQWRCSHCDHEWRTTVKNRTRNHTGCPACQRTRSRQIER